MIGLGAGMERPYWKVFGAGTFGFLLALFICDVLTEPVDISAIVPGAPETVSQTASAETLAAQGASGTPASFPATLTRPLFRADRKPPQAARPDVAETRANRPQVQARLPDGLALVGIVKDGGEAGRALLRSGSADDGKWVGLGYTLDGWRLSQIETSTIQFESGGRKQTLSLFPQKPE